MEEDLWNSVSGIRVTSYTNILVKRCDNLLPASYLYTHDVMRPNVMLPKNKPAPFSPTPTFITTKYNPQYRATFHSPQIVAAK